MSNLFSISTADWIVFSLVLLTTFTSVVYGHWRRRNRSDSDSFLDYLLMGRALTLPVFVATLVATWYGGIFGVTEIAFNHGIYNFLTQGVFWYLTYGIFAIFLVERIRSYEAITLPDLVGKLYGPISSKIAAVFNFFNVVPIAYAISLGIFLQVITGIPLQTSIAFGIVIVLLYSTFGGMKAVVYSDLVQFFVMCVGVFLVLLFSVVEFGGISYLRENLPETHFAPLGGHGLLTTLVWGLIALSTLVDPNFYQRCFAAKSTGVAKRGILLSTLVWLLFDICTTAGAMYARAHLGEGVDSNTAYLNYALEILPLGLKGLFLAGILATILSTLDSYLFIAGNTLAYDLGPKRFRESRWAHRVAVLAVGLLALSMSAIFEGNIKAVWKTLGSYSAACLLLPMLVGYAFPRRFSDRQFSAAVLLAAVVTTLWKWIEKEGFWGEIDEIYPGAATALAVLLISRVSIKSFKMSSR